MATPITLPAAIDASSSLNVSPGFRAVLAGANVNLLTVMYLPFPVSASDFFNIGSGEGGGSTRPSIGMIYPRGQG